MAENNQRNLDNEKIDHVMANPLLRSLRRYFFDTPANQIRSIDLGRSVFRYFSWSGTPIPEDPAALLTATHRLLLDREVTDDDLVRFFLDKVIYENQGSALLTPDLMADVLESDAYKKGASDQNQQVFEKWIREKSMLSKIQQSKPVDVVLYKDNLKRVVNALNLEDKAKVEYHQQIDSMVNTFDELYVNHMHKNGLAELQALAKNSKIDYAERLKTIYSILCSDSDNISCGTIYDTIDKTYAAADVKDRDIVLTSYGIAANKILCGVANRKGWSDQDLQSIILKFPIEERAAKFEKEAARRQTPLTSDAEVMGQAIKNVLQEDQEDNEKAQSSEVNHSQPASAQNESSPVVQTEQAPKFNYALDIAKTFGFTFGGAMAFSAISAIPVFGRFAGPLIATTAIATAGIDQAAMAIKEAKAKGKVTKKEAVKIATKTAGAVLLKMGPYLAATAFGVKVRAVGSAVVMGKAFFNDLERRAGLLNNQLEQEKPKGIRAMLNRLADIANNVSSSDVKKAAGYAFAKGTATFFGGMFGQKAGSKLGTFASEKFFGGNKANVAPVETETQKVQPANESQVTEDPANTQDNSDKKLSSLNEKMINNSNSAETLAQDVNDQSQLSDYNRQRLGQIGRVELTANARATAYVENHRQYIGGVQHDWYNATQEQTALQTLRAAGVDDPYGVLRKVGSASRFFGGEYKATLDNLCSGKLTNEDVKQIFSSLRLINEEGGLGRVMQQSYEAPQPTPQPIPQPIPQPVYEPVYEPVPEDTIVEWPEDADRYKVNADEMFTKPEPVVDDVKYEVPEQTDPLWVDGAEKYKVDADGVGKTVPVIESVQDEVPEQVDDTPWVDGAEKYKVDFNNGAAEQGDSAWVNGAEKFNANLNGGNTEQVKNTPWVNGAEKFKVPDKSGLIYGGNDGVNDYYYDDQGNEFTDEVYQPATLSDGQLARLRADNVRSTDFDPEEAGRYLYSFSAEEIDDMSKYWTTEEKSRVIEILENSITR